MSRYAILREIRGLDPVRDHQRIVYLSSCFDFPWDTTRSLEFALFRTFCVPSIATLLDRTGEFRSRPQKRYDDTDLLLSELLEFGYDSDRGRRAIRRINRIHGRFDISNEDYLYVLSTLTFDPIRWNQRFGWRKMCEIERQAVFHFWRQVGRRMGIRDIPGDYVAFERFSRDYEREHFRYTEAAGRVGRTTRELFVSWMPRPLAPLVRSAIHALVDEPIREAFGFPRPSRLILCITPAMLRIRGTIMRLLPPRRRPRYRTAKPRADYPVGYRIEELGPPPASQ